MLLNIAYYDYGLTIQPISWYIFVCFVQTRVHNLFLCTYSRIHFFFNIWYRSRDVNFVSHHYQKYLLNIVFTKFEIYFVNYKKFKRLLNYTKSLVNNTYILILILCKTKNKKENLFSYTYCKFFWIISQNVYIIFI